MTKTKGSKVVDIQVRCAKCQVPVYEPLNLFAVYKVILSSYMARGGAGLSVINEKKVSHQVGNITDDVLMMNYFKAKSPIITGEENRITFVQEEDKKPSVCGGDGNLRAVNILLALAVFACSVVKDII